MFRQHTVILMMLIIFYSIHSHSQDHQGYSGDRVIHYDDIMVIADEPGITTCPNVSCDIPVNMNVMRKKKDGYQLISQKNITKLNSGSHSLYYYESGVADVFSNRIQKQNEKSYFLTHIKIFDLNKPDYPEETRNVIIKGNILDSKKIKDKIITLTSFFKSESMGHQCEYNETKHGSLYFNVSVVSVLNDGGDHTYCIDAGIESIQSVDLKVFSNSVYITYTDFSNRYIVRYKIVNDELFYDTRLTLKDSVYSSNLGDYIYEKENSFIILGRFKFDGHYQAGMRIFSLDSSSNSMPYFSRTVSFTPGDGINTSIVGVSSNKNDSWYLALSQEGEEKSRLIGVNTRNVALPLLSSSSFYVDGDVNKIIPHENDLISIYASIFPSDLGVGIMTSLTFLDVSNPFDFNEIKTTYLTEGFTHEPLPLLDNATLATQFDEMTGKMIVPLQWAFESKPSDDHDIHKDTPTTIRLELLVFDFNKADNCLKLTESCWQAEKTQTEFLYLPYEGDEPSRARLFIEENSFDYVLGHNIKRFDFN